MLRKIYDKEEMEHFKKNLMEYEKFKRMDQEQQGELLIEWQQTFTIREIAAYMNTQSNKLYSLKNNLKKKGIETNPIAKIKRKREKKKNQAKKEKKSVHPTVREIEAKELETPEPSTEELNKINQDYMQPAARQPVTQIEYVPQQVTYREEEEPKVSLDEFMKMIQIQEKIAEAVEVQQVEKADGFQFKFNGEFNASELSKRLNKVLMMIEDEPSKFMINFSIMELEDAEEESPVAPTPKPELVQEVHSLKDSLEEVQQELKETKEAQASEEEKDMKYWMEGYQNLNNLEPQEEKFKKEQEGNMPDTKKGEKYTGTIEKNNQVLFQAFYICPDCGNKGKHFIPNGRAFVSCHECGKQMNVRSATVGKNLEQDDFGNYYIAGKFKRADERIPSYS